MDSELLRQSAAEAARIAGINVTPTILAYSQIAVNRLFGYFARIADFVYGDGDSYKR